MSARTYAVFISYRHADNKDAGRQWATWLHQGLETYDVPPDLIGQRNRRGEPVQSSLFPVFRDEEELAADADLSLNIRRALEHSGLLVVLCSPRAVASQYVDDEIRYFKEFGKADRILALLIDGEPNAQDETLECLPRSLRFGKPRSDGTIDWSERTQPIAADTRPEGKPTQGWTTAAAYEEALEEAGTYAGRQIEGIVRTYERRLELAKLKIIAGALGVPLDDLTRRNKVFELAKARRRARVLALWLAAVGALAIAAVIAGVFAVRSQRVASEQARVATQERDRAVREAYVNIVRRAAAQVAVGELADARKTLLKASPGSREWEWWYLIARCGPPPVPLTEFAAFDRQYASAMKTRLDAIAAISEAQPDLKAQPTRVSDIVLTYNTYGGRPGTNWEARRIAGKTTILLNGFRTGMYGTLPAAALGDDGRVYWRNADDDGTGRNPPLMASGEQLQAQTDYVAFLRKRFITGDVGNVVPVHESSSDVDLSTWADEPPREPSRIIVDGERVLIIGDADKPAPTLNLATSVLEAGVNPSSLWERFGVDDPPADPALTATLAEKERQSIRPDDLREFRMRAARGPDGPLVLTVWRFGNVRLRDGRTGDIIGESIAPPASPDLIAYSGDAAIVPGTELVAGGFWWEREIIAGVVDLRHKRVLVRFEDAPDLNADFAAWVTGAFRVSPNGNEAAFRYDSRNESYFAVWNLKSGKLVYGPAETPSDAADEEEPKPAAAPQRSSIPLPIDYAWHPDGRFVAIVQPNGVTELRRSFATAPFAMLEGIAASGDFRVQDIGGKNRVLIGNGVVDTTRWETIITLPVGTFVSRDGDLAVVETRPGVIEIVHPGFRRASRNVSEAILSQQIRDADDRQRQATR